MKLLLELCSVFVVISSLPSAEHCSFSHTGNFDPYEVQYIDIPSGCTTGKIVWNYPSGYLHLILSKPSSSFIFCIMKRSRSPLAEQVIDFTGGSRRPLYPSPLDQHVCTRSVNAKTDVAVKALADMAYMTSFDYTVN